MALETEHVYLDSAHGSHLSQSLVISEAKGNHQKCRSIEFVPQTQALPEPNVRHASPPFRQDDTAHSMKISQSHCSHSFLDLPCFASTHIDQMGIFRKKTMTNWDMMWYNSQANNSQYSSTCKKAGNTKIIQNLRLTLSLEGKDTNNYLGPTCLWSHGQIMTQYQIILLYEHFQNIKNTHAHSDILRPSKWDRSNSRLVWAATSQSRKQYIKHHQTTNHFVSSGYGLVLIPKWIAFDPPNHDQFCTKALQH